MPPLLIPTFFCPKSWEEMQGDESQRFCSYCKKFVHNLDALTLHERLALLSSPAGSICSRYRLAIRRPAKGKEDAYRRRLLQSGLGVAAAGSVLLTLWEIQVEGSRDVRYRVATNVHFPGDTCTVPEELYVETCHVFLGFVVEENSDQPADDVPIPEHTSARPYVDLKLDLRTLVPSDPPQQPPKVRVTL